MSFDQAKCWFPSALNWCQKLAIWNRFQGPGAPGQGKHFCRMMYFGDVYMFYIISGIVSWKNLIILMKYPKLGCRGTPTQSGISPVKLVHMFSSSDSWKYRQIRIVCNRKRPIWSFLSKARRFLRKKIGSKTLPERLSVKQKKNEIAKSKLKQKHRPEVVWTKEKRKCVSFCSLAIVSDSKGAGWSEM